jgi:hypothetical protein
MQLENVSAGHVDSISRVDDGGSMLPQNRNNHSREYAVPQPIKSEEEKNSEKRKSSRLILRTSSQLVWRD